MEMKNIKKGITAVLAMASCLAAGCASQQQQYPPYGGTFPGLPPIGSYPGTIPGQIPGQLPGQIPGQLPPIQIGQLPGQGPIQLPPVPQKGGYLNPGQYSPVTQLGQTGYIPYAPATGTQVAGTPAMGNQAGYVDPNAQFQPAAPLAPSNTSPAAPVNTASVPQAPVTSPTYRFTADQINSLSQSVAQVSGTGFDTQFAQIQQAQGWTAYQKYTALSQLAAQIAQRLQSDGTGQIQQLQAYVKQFSPDQGAQVNTLMGQINGLTEATIKTQLQAEHQKVTAEMQTQLTAANTAAAQPVTQPGTTATPVAQPQTTVPVLGGQLGAPAPQYLASQPYYTPVQMFYVRMAR
jgi:hypothetical protein